MSTNRLYYTDSMAAAFDATVVSSEAVHGRAEAVGHAEAVDRAEVVLDQTAFYPTSGGQPFDTGTLHGAGKAGRVVDVIDRDDGEIVHVVSSPLPVGERVRGEIDWPRRFDHMQQHTGQHLLSAAFDRGSCHAATVSFHLGTETSTIDLACEVTPSDISAAERAANQIIWDDRPVVVRFATDDEASRLPLRKEPARTGLLRLVEVADFDLSACGGTHVPRAGMIGLIAVAGWERFKGGSRIAFVCGGRALDAHGHLRDVVATSARLLSVSAGDLPATIERLQHEAKSLSRRVRQLQDESATFRATRLRADAETIAGVLVVLKEEPGWETAALKSLAAAVVSEPGFIVVLVGEGQPAPVVVARSADTAFDAAQWIKRATIELGGRGGGRPELAQGGLAGPAERILAWARHTLGEHPAG